jgi:Xaa-Pro aminopeptidase
MGYQKVSMNTSIQINQVEYQKRCDKLLEVIQTKKLSGVILFDNFYLLYYTGFAFIPTERPIAFIMNSQGERALFVPRLEVEHARSMATISRVDYYVEYPHERHPLEILKKTLDEMGIGDQYGADQDGSLRIMGYRGPSLTQVIGHSPHPIAESIEDQMMVKSPAELGLIRESIKWGNLAHTLLQRYTRVGATETAVSQRASTEATLAMLDSIGPIYRAQNPYYDGPGAGYRGQIGRNAAIPHALSNNIVFQAGDILVTGAGAPMWGYNSELERTMVIGPASDEQKRMFDHMLALQKTGFEAIRAGSHCSDVDKAVRAYYVSHDLQSYWKHHVGHAIGLREHEGPFLDVGDQTIIKPGMVFTVEPGLYVPQLGGFRHSDTVAVTEEGIEILTYYPRDLESLTIPV